MIVSLVGIDASPNIALEKIRMFYKQRGDKVDDNLGTYDKRFVSVIFTKNREKAKEYIDGKTHIGGTGWDLNSRLPKEVEALNPKINYGFTTRGCIRKCEFCFVPKMEGDIRGVADIYDIWDGKSKTITLLDNNILALKDHFKKISGQILKEGITVDFNQGLDIRLLNKENTEILMKLKRKEYRFSWDNDMDMEELFRKTSEYFRSSCVYVFVGKNSDDGYVWHRLRVLKKLGYRPYLMREAGVDRKWNNVARWVNQRWCFQKYTYDEFCKADQEYNRRKTPWNKKAF